MKQHLKQTALTVLFSSAVLSSLAAPIHIKGLVRDADNSPLPGASITLINDSKTGTLTNIDGQFSLQAEPGSELGVKYMG